MTIARAYDQGENYSTMPNDIRFLSADYGPSGDVPTFTGTANGSYDVNRAMQLSWVFHIRSGLRIDPKVGPTVDLNGDGNFNDRTPGLARNSFTAPSTNSLDARFTWNLPVHPGKVQLTVEGFNLYNRANYQNIQTLFGSDPNNPNPLFGTALSYYPPRQVQVGARIAF